MKLVEIMQRGKKTRVDTLHGNKPSCGIRWNRDATVDSLTGYADNSRYLGTVDMIDHYTGKHYQIQMEQLEWEDIREAIDKAFAEAPA